MRAPAVILVQWPDKLRIELQDPVGSLLGLLVVAEGKFWLYQNDKPEILTGSFRSFPSDRITAASSPEDLVSLFLARPPFGRIPQDAVRPGRAEFRRAGFVEAVEWNETLLEPLRWTEKGEGHPFGQVIYKNYEFRGGTRFPTSVEFANSQTTILIDWREWEPSVPNEKKLFQIPQQQTFGRKIKALP